MKVCKRKDEGFPCILIIGTLKEEVIGVSVPWPPLQTESTQLWKLLFD